MRANLGAVPWADIIGMRHRLIHGYDNVNLDLVWETVRDRLPPLIQHLDPWTLDAS